MLFFGAVAFDFGETNTEAAAGLCLFLFLLPSTGEEMFRLVVLDNGIDIQGSVAPLGLLLTRKSLVRTMSSSSSWSSSSSSSTIADQDDDFPFFDRAITRGEIFEPSGVETLAVVGVGVVVVVVVGLPATFLIYDEDEEETVGSIEEVEDEDDEDEDEDEDPDASGDVGVGVEAEVGMIGVEGAVVAVVTPIVEGEDDGEGVGEGVKEDEE